MVTAVRNYANTPPEPTVKMWLRNSDLVLEIYLHDRKKG
jgi:hypothetical protein